jgi:hypothetical protein
MIQRAIDMKGVYYSLKLAKSPQSVNVQTLNFQDVRDVYTRVGTGITLRYVLRCVHLRGADDRTSCFTYKQTGAIYRTFLLNVLPVFFEDVPLQQRQHTWLIHDASRTHILRTARQHLNLDRGYNAQKQSTGLHNSLILVVWMFGCGNT